MSSKLNVRQWIIASIVVFVFLSVWGFLVNRLIMPGLFPPPSTAESMSMAESGNPLLQRFWIYCGRAVFALLFVYIFTRGYEGKPGLGEGLRYGLWIGLFLNLPGVPGNLIFGANSTEVVVAQSVLWFLSYLLCGLFAGAIYKAPPKLTA
jgi:hypothetical protein